MPDRYHHGDLRRALLDTASALIAQSGVGAVTFRTLAERIGVSRSAPYRHFRDKAALLAGVAAEGFERLTAAVRAAREGGGAHPGTFVTLAEVYVGFALEHPAHYRLMYGRDAVARQSQPALQEAADALYDELVGLIAEAQAEGQLRAGDPEQLAYIAWATVHGLALLLVDGQMEPPEDPIALTRLTALAVLEGLAA